MESIVLIALNLIRIVKIFPFLSVTVVMGLVFAIYWIVKLIWNLKKRYING